MNFNLNMTVSMDEKNEIYEDNKFVRGLYTLDMTPAFPYKMDGQYKLAEKILYELEVVNGIEGSSIKTQCFKVIRPHQNPACFELIELEGIESESLRRMLADFVSSFTCNGDH